MIKVTYARDEVRARDKKRKRIFIRAFNGKVTILSWHLDQKEALKLASEIIQRVDKHGEGKDISYQPRVRHPRS